MLDSALIGPSGGTVRVGRNELVGLLERSIDPVMVRGEVLDAPIASFVSSPKDSSSGSRQVSPWMSTGAPTRKLRSKIFDLDDDGNVLEEIDAEYNPAWKRVAAPINHLSRNALGV